MKKWDDYQYIIKYRYKAKIRIVFSVITLLLVPFVTFAQSDTIKKSMTFDFGLTRDRNINLWPIYKRTITKYEIDKQFIFPIYRNYKNLKLGEKRSHVLPFYWKDSSENSENLRILSTYYPSIFHLAKNKEENTKTFTFVEFAPRINLLEFKKSPDGLVMQNNLLFFLWYQNNQVTKREHLIVFPAYWHFKNRVKETTTLFPIYSFGDYRQGESNYLAITPLYWHFKSAKRSSNLLVPILWNRKVGVGDDISTTSLVLPVYWSRKDKKVDSKVFFPIYWSIKNPRYQSLSVLPFFSTGYSYDLERKHQIITPFYWHFKNNEGESKTFFPLIWSSSWKTRYENYSSFVVFPLYWAQRNNDIHTQVLLPFIWNRVTPDYHSFTFVPLLSVGKSPDESVKHLVVTPFFWHFSSPELKSNTIFPLWWYRKKGLKDETTTSNIVFPLYWGRKDVSSQHNIFFPLVWNFKNTEYHTFTFIPFYSSGKSSDGKSSYAAYTPLYWKFKTEQGGNGQLFFPLWWKNNKTINGELKSSSLVVLLYWKYKDNLRNHQGLFPIAWNLKNQYIKSFTIFPIYSKGQSLTRNNSFVAVTPLYWKFNSSKRSTSSLFPIWWNRKVYQENNTQHFNLLIPIYFAKWDSVASKRVIFPVIWSFKNTYYRSFTFLPLFSTGGSIDNSVGHLVITPLFWYVRNPNGFTTTIIPLFWWSKYGEDDSAEKWCVLAPIYWTNSDSRHKNSVIFPILWRFSDSNYKSFTLAPLFSFGKSPDDKRKHLVVTPLYWKLRDQRGCNRVLFPIWFNSQKIVQKKLVKTNVVFPLYWSFNNQVRSTKVFFPIIWSFKKPNSYSNTFIPFYSAGENAKGVKHIVITPLYWSFDSKSEHSRMLLPFFTRYWDNMNNKQFDIFFFLYRHSSNADSSKTGIVWPIIEQINGKQYKYFRFAPLIWSKKSPSFSYFTFQPFFYHSYSSNHKTYRILWELYTYKEQIGELKSNSILWKVATWDRYANGDREFRILYLLYSNSKVGGKVEKSLFPLYYYTKDDEGNRSLSVFFYFYNSLKRKISNTKEFYQEERIFWLIRIRSNYSLLKQKGINID